MYLDQKTKDILINKLKFSFSTIDMIDSNFELAAKAIGIMEILKKSPPSVKLKSHVIRQLLSIEKHAGFGFSNRDDKKVKQAYLEHYSFR